MGKGIKTSNIQSSQTRGTPLEHTVINNFMPQNVASLPGARKDLNTAGKDTKNIQKSSSKEQMGPETNNL